MGRENGAQSGSDAQQTSIDLGGFDAGNGGNAAESQQRSQERALPLSGDAPATGARPAPDFATPIPVVQPAPSHEPVAHFEPQRSEPGKPSIAWSSAPSTAVDPTDRRED